MSEEATLGLVIFIPTLLWWLRETFPGWIPAKVCHMSAILWPVAVCRICPQAAIFQLDGRR